MRALKDRHVSFRVLNIASDSADEGLQVLGPAGKEKSSLVAVGIDVSDGMRFQFIHVSFNPLHRSKQSGLFSIPRAIDDGALGSPALAMQFAQHARFLQHRGLAGDRIVGAVYPGVVMIAAQHPLLAAVRAAQCADDVVDRFDVPVGSNFEMHLRRPGTDVISDGQRPTPSSRERPGLSAPRAAEARRA